MPPAGTRQGNAAKNDNSVYWTSDVTFVRLTDYSVGVLCVFGIHATAQLLVGKRFVMVKIDDKALAYLLPGPTKEPI